MDKLAGQDRGLHIVNDRQFLIWLRDRLVNRYGESPNVDFVRKLEAIADETDPLKDSRPK